MDASLSCLLPQEFAYRLATSLLVVAGGSNWQQNWLPYDGTPPGGLEYELSV